MRTIIWFIYFWLYLLVKVPKMRRAGRLEAAGDIAGCKAIVDEVIPKWASSLLRLAGAEVTVTGQENLPKGPAVYVANHQGYFDIPIMLTALNGVHPLLSRQGVGKIPLIRTWMKRFGCQFVDRSDPRQAVGCINEIVRLIEEQGRSVTIFPEGTRSWGGPVGEFKAGGFKIAEKTGLPVVPVVIDGSHKLMEANKMWIKPAKVRVKILPAIATAEMSRAERKSLAEDVRGIIVKEMGEL